MKKKNKLVSLLKNQNDSQQVSSMLVYEEGAKEWQIYIKSNLDEAVKTAICIESEGFE